MPYKIHNFASVIVLYKPNLIDLKQIVHKHEKNFNSIILVNNSPKISLKNFQSKNTSIIYNNSNIGLASALNIGILEAKKQGAEMVALFDQDTELPLHFTKDMLNYINHYQGDKPVAVYSPIFYNYIINKIGKHINFKLFRLIRATVSENDDYAHPHYVITSGSILPIEVLDDIGLMREELFIDFVDIEWCLRARRHNYEIVAINKVRIDHHLGDYAVKFMGERYPIHSPLRMYFQLNSKSRWR
jgi:rhamnosyltransferase